MTHHIFNVVILPVHEKSLLTARIHGWIGAYVIDPKRHPFLTEAYFYLNDPHSAIMYKVHIREIISSRDKPEKWEILFDGNVEAIPHIHYRGAVKTHFESRQYTHAAWLAHLEQRLQEHNIPYHIEDVLDQGAIMAFVKAHGLLSVGDGR